MRAPQFHALSLIAMLCAGCATTGQRDATPTREPTGPTTIAFGACCHQDRPQPVWDAVVAAEPDLFIFTGDNIYGDTEDMAILQAKYDKLAAIPGYQRLLEACPVLAVYDDHDYGQNDGGREYPMRAESAAMCLDFFGVPDDDPRRGHEGVYGSTILGEPGRRVQVILLDTRYFRDALDRGTLTAQERAEEHVVGWYTPTDDTTRTLLGREQWRWLAGELQKDAEVRVIVSSIQVVSWEKGMECWGNMPHERDTLFGLIEATGANGVVFISGDVHFAELSMSDEGPYPLYDLTSSGLAQAPHPSWPAAYNTYRQPDMLYDGENFGVIQIQWAGDDTVLTMQARNVEGAIAFEQDVPLRELNP
ncbi:alkaline phosphatase D family protein [Phycisphaeraceae bacterium D3-23]